MKKTKAKPAKSKVIKKTQKSGVIKTASQPFDKFRKKLLNMRQDLLQVVERKKNQDLPEKEVGDEADAATHSIERELIFEMSDNERMALDAIEAALRKIEHDKYGLCESCSKKIVRERLEIMPYARYCVACQSKFESPRV